MRALRRLRPLRYDIIKSDTAFSLTLRAATPQAATRRRKPPGPKVEQTAARPEDSRRREAAPAAARHRKPPGPQSCGPPFSGPFSRVSEAPRPPPLQQKCKRTLHLRTIFSYLCIVYTQPKTRLQCSEPICGCSVSPARFRAMPYPTFLRRILRPVQHDQLRADYPHTLHAVRPRLPVRTRVRLPGALRHRPADFLADHRLPLHPHLRHGIPDIQHPRAAGRDGHADEPAEQHVPLPERLDHRRTCARVRSSRCATACSTR